MNVPLLRRIQRQIDKAPHKFAMANYQQETECGTAYCIAGWTWLLTEGKIPDAAAYRYEYSPLLSLEISLKEGERLFNTCHWPEQFIAADGDPELPALAIARIDHFIATEGRE
jgi:hypothetical protein